MNLLLTALMAGGLVALLFKVAIVCVIVWGIMALLQWAGIVVPRPLQIILICLACIICLYWLWEAFGALV